jgi:hypothetical protein
MGVTSSCVASDTTTEVKKKFLSRDGHTEKNSLERERDGHVCVGGMGRRH